MHSQTKLQKLKKLIILIVSCIFIQEANSQIHYTSNNSQNSNFIQNLSGPRIGFTVITDGVITEALDDEFGVQTNFVTQFGYQFEKQIMGDENVAGLVEGIVMLAGIEKGLFLPSLSGMFGARFASGYEFAAGPNLSLSGAGMILAIGKTINAGNLNIPINLAWVPSVTRREATNHYDYNSETGIYEEWVTYSNEPTGNRFTLTIGFNFRTR